MVVLVFLLLDVLLVVLLFYKFVVIKKINFYKLLKKKINVLEA